MGTKLTVTTPFVANQSVTYSNLNDLVGEAEIQAGAVGASELASGAITNSKISATANILLSKLAAAAGKLIGASSAGNATEVTVTDGLTYAGTISSPTLGIVTAGIQTSYIQDDAVTVDKLADSLVFGASAVVDFSAAAASAITLPDKNISYAKLGDDAISAATTATPVSGDYLLFHDDSATASPYLKKATVQEVFSLNTLSTSAVPQSATWGQTGTVTAWSHALSAVPSYVRLVLVCTSAEEGYAVGEEFDLAYSYGAAGAGEQCLYGYSATSAAINLIRSSTGDPKIMSRTNGAYFTPASGGWSTKAYYRA